MDVLPLIGLSAATVFLNDYRTPLVALNLGMNALGIAIIGRQFVAARRRCLIPTLAPEATGA